MYQLVLRGIRLDLESFEMFSIKSDSAVVNPANWFKH